MGWPGDAGGGIPATEFTFPYEDDSFDLVFGLSLFTHLLPADLERYLHETRRVLRPGGRSLYTFFLLRPKGLLERDKGDFSTLYDEAEALIAYRQGYVRGAYSIVATLS